MGKSQQWFQTTLAATPLNRLRREKTPIFFRQEKKSTKINFLGPETARWGGVLPREGVVAEKFVPALESFSSLGFE